MNESTKILKEFVEGLLDEKDDFIKNDAKNALAKFEKKLLEEKEEKRNEKNKNK